MAVQHLQQRSREKLSLSCISCKKWVHRRCSGVKGSLQRASTSFRCRICLNGNSSSTVVQSRLSLDNDSLEFVDNFCYLGDVLDTDGGVESAVTARIRSGWCKFKELSAFLTSKAPALSVKGKVYAACVRQRMIYGSETWAMRSEQEQRLSRAEMKMVRWMSGRSLRERKSNEELRRAMGIEPTQRSSREADYVGSGILREEKSRIG